MTPEVVMAPATRELAAVVVEVEMAAMFATLVMVKVVITFAKLEEARWTATIIDLLARKPKMVVVVSAIVGDDLELQMTVRKPRISTAATQEIMEIAVIKLRRTTLVPASLTLRRFSPIDQALATDQTKNEQYNWLNFELKLVP